MISPPHHEHEVAMPADPIPSPLRVRVMAAATLLALFLAALFAAQFGFLGIGLYLLAVVLLVG